jgi:hypothetical protein
MYHQDLEFILLAFAMWHVPASPLNIKIYEDDISSSYSAYSADDARRFLATGSTYGASSSEYKTFSCLRQVKQNVHGRTAGFSLSLALVSVIYIFKWMEIVLDVDASLGARTIAKYQSAGYLGTFLMMLLSYFMSANNSRHVVWMWMGSSCVYIFSLFMW